MKSLTFIALAFFISAESFAASNLKVVLAPADGDGYINKATIIPAAGATAPTLIGAAKAPVMFYDTTEVAYEKGVPNTTFSKYSPTDAISKNQTLYDPKSPWGNAGGTFYIRSDSENARHRRANKYYFGATPTANLQAPRVHNKDTPWPTNEPKKLYVSWWYKPQNDTRDYFSYQLSNVAGDFKPQEGDEFVVAVDRDSTGSTSVFGRVIKYDAATGILTGNFFGQRNSNRVKDHKLTLNKNGASAMLGTMISWQGSNKYIRVWESDGAETAMRLSWTNTEIYAADMRGYPYSPVLARQWNHMEVFIDQIAKKVMTKVNGKIDYVGTYTGDEDKIGFAPAIGLIGFDPSPEGFQQIWMDDIYSDTSFRRVTLSNEAKYANVTHEEVQYYTSWTADKIEFIPNVGSLDTRDKAIYAYVYSDDNVPNSEGILVPGPFGGCFDSKSADCK